MSERGLLGLGDCWPIATFGNRSRNPNSECIIRVLAGPTREQSIFRDDARGVWFPLDVIEQDFVLDTGAQVSLISGRVARRLELPQDSPVELRVVGGAIVAGVSTEINVCIGDNWYTVPCLVRHPVERTDYMPNLLGMRGILSRFKILVASEQAVFFEKHGDPTENPPG